MKRVGKNPLTVELHEYVTALVPATTLAQYSDEKLYLMFYKLYHAAYTMF